MHLIVSTIKKMKHWTRPLIKQRKTFGARRMLLHEPRTGDLKTLRMDDAAFQELLQLVTPLIK
jgi:hypothetical protein